MLVKGSIPGHKGSVVIIKPTQKRYTPKEIYTEDVMEASPITDEDSDDESDGSSGGSNPAATCVPHGAA